jgi:hypothetical protein
MNARDANFDLEAVDDIRMSLRGVGNNRIPRASDGSAALIANRPGTAGGPAGGGDAAAFGDWLCLAAAPAFAIMALLTAAIGGGSSDMLCSAAQDAWPLSGMTAMYLLMTVFHLAPWLKLISRRRSGVQRS